MQARRIDPIAEQLKRLDEQLQPTQPLIQIILTVCPAVIPAVGFILGISLRQNCPISWHWPLAAAFLTLLAGLVCFRIQSIFRRAYIAAFVLFLMFAWLGMLRLEYFYVPYPDDARFLLRPQPYPAIIRGIIVSDIFKENRKGWVFGGYQFTSPRRSFYLSLEEYQTKTGRWQTAKGIIRIQINEPAFHIQTADHVQMYCILSGFEGPANPGQFDFQKAMLRRGVLVGASVETADGITVLHRQSGWSFRRANLWLKNSAWKALLDEMPDETDQRTAMATALLLGYQKTIDPQTNEAFIKTGLSHIISLSGMHMAIIAAMVWAMARLTGMEKCKRAILTFVVITLYAMVVPPQPPTLRAVVIFWFFCAAIWFRRSLHPVNTLAVTSVVLLLYRPMDLFRADWQLSYGTLFGILLFYKPMKSFISRFTLEPLSALPIDNRWTNSLYFIVKILVEVFSAGFAAWAGGAGILLWHFGAVVPACPLWTAIISPIVPVILYLGFFKILLAGLFPTFSALLGWVIIWCSDVFASAVRFFAHIDFTSVRLGTVPGWIPIMYYLLIFLWFCRMRIRPAWVKIGTVLLSTAIVAGLFAHQSRQKNSLSLMCLSVGHGQAIVLSTPDKKTYLFDAGSITNKDPGTRAIIPYLKYRGIDSFDAAFISHGDLDHYNALPEIAAGGFVKTVYVNAGLLDRAQNGGAAKLLTDTLQGKYSVPVKPIADFPPSRGPVIIRTVWPRDDEPAQALSENDRSEVFLIAYAGKTILLCGDIETYAQQKIIEQYPELKADILILPHHGSTTNLSEEFVRRFAAGIIVASCAESRLPGTYKPAQNTDAFYTGRDGAVEVKMKADGTIHAAGFIRSQ
jgi:competence protein ComEC